MTLWTQPSQRLFSFDVFEVDLWTGELRKTGTKIKVQEQPLKVLAMLLARPGELVTREQLREGLWSDDTFVDVDRGLNTAVNRLRAALDDSAETPRFVETVGSRGYRFIAPVVGKDSGKTKTSTEFSASSNRLDEWPSVSQTALSSESTPQPWGPTVPRKSYLRAAIVVVILIAAGTISYYGVHRWKSSASLNLESLRFTKLTNSGKAEDVAISPDGSYVVYSQRDHDGVGLWLHHIATGSETQILPSEDIDFRGLTFSPDGNSVSFVRTRKQIGSFKDLYAMPVLGGHARLLTRDIDSPVSFSPDGRQFAFIEGFPDGNRIRIANADGSGDRALATFTGTLSSFQPGPAWSPDGRTIAVPLMLGGDRRSFVLDSVSPLEWKRSGGFLASLSNRPSPMAPGQQERTDRAG